MLTLQMRRLQRRLAWHCDDECRLREPHAAGDSEVPPAAAKRGGAVMRSPRACQCALSSAALHEADCRNSSSSDCSGEMLPASTTSRTAVAAASACAHRRCTARCRLREHELDRSGEVLPACVLA